MYQNYISKMNHREWTVKERTAFQNVSKRLVNTGLFKMIVGVLTTCRTKYT